MADTGVEQHYALETRSEVLKLASAVAVRRGASDRVEIGRAASSDAVAGLETQGVGGQLVESARSRLTRAERLETRIGGKLSSQGRSDTTLLGGAMAETYAGAMLVMAGMSDDLVAGGGARVSASGDLWLAGLVGFEERIGTVSADAALLEAYGTHFEREYGNGNHTAGFARFSGTVHTTVASGFRPLFKVMTGVRNLTPGSGSGAAADTPDGTAPAPPSASSPPRAAGAGSATGLLGDTPAVANASEAALEPLSAVPAVEDVSDLTTDCARGADTADNLDEVRRGNDPMATLDAQAQLGESSEAARFSGEADELAESADSIQLITDNTVTANTANRVEGPDVYDLLRTLDDKTHSTRVNADWDPHRWLSQAGDELEAINEQFRRLLEQRLSPEELAEITSYRNSAAVRDALVAAYRGATNPDELAHLKETIQNYDNLVRRVINDALTSVDESAGRTADWPWLVDQERLAEALGQEVQRHGDAISDSAGTGLVNEAEVIKTNQDYLNVYNLAITNIQRGTNPLGYMDEEIRFVEYHVRSAEAAAYRAQTLAEQPGLSTDEVQRAIQQARRHREKAANQQARLSRLLDARTVVYRAMQTYAVEDIGTVRTAFGAFDNGPTSLEGTMPPASGFAGDEPWEVSLRAGQAGDADNASVGLAAAEDAGTLRFEGTPMEGTNSLTDLSTDEARRIDDSALGNSGYEIDSGLPWGDEADSPSGFATADNWMSNAGQFDGYEMADNWMSNTGRFDGYEMADNWMSNTGRFDGYEVDGFSVAGDYPQLPSALPSDVDAENLRQAIRDARQAVPEGDEARRRALSVAIDAVSRGEDPAAAINDTIAAAKAGHNTDPLLGYDQVDILADVNALLNRLVDQNRSANTFVSDFDQVDDARRLEALREQTGNFSHTGSVQAQPYELPTGMPQTYEEFVHRAPGQAGLDVDATRYECAQIDDYAEIDEYAEILDYAEIYGYEEIHQYEEIHEYADLPIHIRDGEIDAANHTYATVRERRWPNRITHEADPLRKGPPAVLTIKDDDLGRLAGFLQTADGSDDPLNGVPLIRVTQAEKMAIDDGDIAVKVIDTSTFQQYQNYRMVANRPDGIDGGVSRKLSPPDLMRAIAREHDDYFKRHATWARRQWGRMPLPSARFQPVSLGPDGVFRPIDLRPL